MVESIFIVETVSTLPLRMETSPGMSTCITTGSPSQYRKAGKQRLTIGKVDAKLSSQTTSFYVWKILRNLPKNSTRSNE